MLLFFRGVKIQKQTDKFKAHTSCFTAEFPVFSFLTVTFNIILRSDES